MSGALKWRCFGGPNDGLGSKKKADVVCPDGEIRRLFCLDVRLGESPCPLSQPPGCLMRCCLCNTGIELCSDVNHDPNLDTRQSLCNEGRSCWAQFAREWPSVIKMPDATPVPGPTMAPAPVVEVAEEAHDQLVLLLDWTGNMGFGLGTPHRTGKEIIEQIDLDLGVRLGVAFFCDCGIQVRHPLCDGTNCPGKTFPLDAGLRALESESDRQEAKDAVDRVIVWPSAPNDYQARLGEGLAGARDLILEDRDLILTNGVAYIESRILYLGRGINEGSESDFEEALQSLAEEGIVVDAICIQPEPWAGDDLGAERCAKMTERTGGKVVGAGSPDEALAIAVEYAARLREEGAVASSRGQTLLHGQTSAPEAVLVEEGTREARLVLSWTDASADLDLQVFRPDGSQVPASQVEATDSSEVLRIENPQPGTWTMRAWGVDVPAPPARYSLFASLRHDAIMVDAGLEEAVTDWPRPFRIFALPSYGDPLSGCKASARITLPDGSLRTVEMEEEGPGLDSVQGGGLYAAEFRDFAGGGGLHRFEVTVSCDPAGVAYVPEEDMSPDPPSPPPSASSIPAFTRTVRFDGHVTWAPANLPPVAKICRSWQVECQGDPTEVGLDGTCSYDPEGQTIAYAWSSRTGSFDQPDSPAPRGRFSLGSHDIFLHVTEATGPSSDLDKALVVVADTFPPVLLGVPADTTTECDAVPSPAGVDAEDACDAIPEVTLSPERTDGRCEDVYLLERTWTARDASGNEATDSQEIRVEDTTPPTFPTFPPDEIVECEAVPPPARPTASDNCDDDVPLERITWPTAGSCPGEYLLEHVWTATDRCDNAVERTQRVEVRDTMPPVVEETNDDLFCVWPPNHGLVPFKAGEFQPMIQDACSEPVTWQFVGCDSDQPADGRGDGHTAVDCVVDGDGQGFSIRAERAGGDKKGRRYAVTIEARDACGNISAPAVIGHVQVLHDRSADLEACRSVK